MLCCVFVENKKLCFVCLAVFNINLSSVDEPVTSDSPIYVELNEELIGQHTIAFEEKKEWNFGEIETFRSTSIIENFINTQQQQSM